MEPSKESLSLRPRLRSPLVRNRCARNCRGPVASGARRRRAGAAHRVGMRGSCTESWQTRRLDLAEMTCASGKQLSRQRPGTPNISARAGAPRKGTPGCSAVTPRLVPLGRVGDCDAGCPRVDASERSIFLGHPGNAAASTGGSRRAAACARPRARSSPTALAWCS